MVAPAFRAGVLLGAFGLGVLIVTCAIWLLYQANTFEDRTTAYAAAVEGTLLPLFNSVATAVLAYLFGQPLAQAAATLLARRAEERRP